MENNWDAAKDLMSAYVRQMNESDRNADDRDLDDAEAVLATAQVGGEYETAEHAMENFQQQLDGIQAGDTEESDLDPDGDEMRREASQRTKSMVQGMTAEEKQNFLDDFTEEELERLQFSNHQVVAAWPNEQVYAMHTASRYYDLYKREKKDHDRARWLLLMSACYMQLAGRYVSDFERFERAREVEMKLGPFWTGEIAELESEADIYPMMDYVNRMIGIYEAIEAEKNK